MEISVSNLTFEVVLDSFHYLYFKLVGRDSAVGIATRYGLGGPGIESRLGAKVSVSFQTGPGAHPASYTMVPGISRRQSGQGVTLNTHPI